MEFESFDSFIQRMKTEEKKKEIVENYKELKKMLRQFEEPVNIEALSRRIKEEELLEKIDKSLDQRNEDDFYHYTNELNLLRQKTSF